jgi:hypothetical protein
LTHKIKDLYLNLFYKIQKKFYYKTVFVSAFFSEMTLSTLNGESDMGEGPIEYKASTETA